MADEKSKPKTIGQTSQDHIHFAGILFVTIAPMALFFAQVVYLPDF
jgi:hypothetical protein